MKCCDKLMAFLLFYGVIKFLLITLPQKSSKGREASRDKAVQLGRDAHHQLPVTSML